MKHLSKGEWVAVIAVILLACIACCASYMFISDLAIETIGKIKDDAKERAEAEEQCIHIEVPITVGVSDESSEI
jgi:hypothetical protein